MIPLIVMPRRSCEECGAFRWKRATLDEYRDRGGYVPPGLVEPDDVVKFFTCGACAEGVSLVAYMVERVKAAKRPEGEP